MRGRTGLRLEGPCGPARVSDVTDDLRQKDWEHSQAVKNTTLTPRKYLLIPSENDLLKCTGMCRDLVFRILWFK